MAHISYYDISAAITPNEFDGVSNVWKTTVGWVTSCDHALLRASSKGHYFASYIKDKYRCRKIRG